MALFNKKESDPTDLPPPGLPLLALELRAPWEFGAVLPAWPVLQRAPLGDGHTVIVFPGLTAGDATTVPLRRYLESRNYDTLGWGQGLNLGPRDGVLETAKRQLQEAAQASGGKVSLVGWSLGGVYARELAKEIGKRFGVMPSFMAKWSQSLPGCSGHIHQSLSDGKKNLFFDAKSSRSMSKLFESYLAGQVACLMEFAPMFWPTRVEIAIDRPMAGTMTTCRMFDPTP